MGMGKGILAPNVTAAYNGVSSPQFCNLGARMLLQSQVANAGQKRAKEGVNPSAFHTTIRQASLRRCARLAKTHLDKIQPLLISRPVGNLDVYYVHHWPVAAGWEKGHTFPKKRLHPKKARQARSTRP